MFSWSCEVTPKPSSLWIILCVLSVSLPPRSMRIHTCIHMFVFMYDIQGEKDGVLLSDSTNKTASGLLGGPQRRSAYVAVKPWLHESALPSPLGVTRRLPQHAEF